MPLYGKITRKKIILVSSALPSTAQRSREASARASNAANTGTAPDEFHTADSSSGIGGEERKRTCSVATFGIKTGTAATYATVAIHTKKIFATER